MMIDEAIIHCEEVAIRKLKNENNAKCVQCGEEHIQLAKWLKELKDYKSGEDVVPVVRCKDCKHDISSQFDTVARCNLWGCLKPKKGFCDAGKRREE